MTPFLSIIFVTINEDSAVATNGTQGPQEYSHHWKYLQGHPSMRNIALKLISVFLPTNTEASWLLFPSSISLLSGCNMQPKNTYLCILR